MKAPKPAPARSKKAFQAISPASEAWAGALFDMAFEEGGGGEALLREIFHLAEALGEREIFRFFLSPAIPLKDKRETLAAALKAAAGPLPQNFLFLLLEKGRFGLLPEICLTARNLLDEKNNILRGELFAAAPLSPEEKSRAEAAAARFFSKKVILEERRDKSLVGGFCLRAGGWLLSGAASHYLKKFQDD